MDSEATMKPAKILLIGVKLIPSLRRPGKSRWSIMGIRMIKARGSMFRMMSLGTLWRVSVAACDVRLPMICP